MKLPDAKPETWKDLEELTDWALAGDWDDERIIAVCELFLKLQQMFDQRDKDRVKH